MISQSVIFEWLGRFKTIDFGCINVMELELAREYIFHQVHSLRMVVNVF